MSQIVISTHDLVRRFGDNVAVNRLSLEVRAGEVFGFLGHNGAGKTTTVRLLNGVLAPNGGRAEVLGLSPLADGPALRRRTGVLTENPSLEERLTARENLAIYAELYGIPQAQVAQRVEGMLETFGLADRAGERVGGYSKGMKQRMALARAMLHDPELLFLDEPTSGLDPVSARHVHELIEHQSRQEGRTVFLCTHNLVEAQRLCDRVGVMEHGRLIAIGTPAELARQVVRHVRLELEVAREDIPAATEVLHQEASVTGLVQENSTLGVTGVDRDEIPPLLAALVAAGVRVYRISPQEPSLEDVYFALQGKAPQEDAVPHGEES
jgi:ABC-2 type transport system ATP-binding protein